MSEDQRQAMMELQNMKLDLAYTGTVDHMQLRLFCLVYFNVIGCYLISNTTKIAINMHKWHLLHNQ